LRWARKQEAHDVIIAKWEKLRLYFIAYYPALPQLGLYQQIFGASVTLRDPFDLGAWQITM
jgi:hypothetical protein